MTYLAYLWSKFRTIISRVLSSCVDANVNQFRFSMLHIVYSPRLPAIAPGAPVCCLILDYRQRKMPFRCLGKRYDRCDMAHGCLILLGQISFPNGPKLLRAMTPYWYSPSPGTVRPSVHLFFPVLIHSKLLSRFLRMRMSCRFCGSRNLLVGPPDRNARNVQQSA